MAAEVRRLTSGDLAGLASFVQAAHGRGDLAGSSDPVAAFVMRIVSVEPETVAVAEDDGQLVGFIAPGFKVVVVDPGSRRRGIGRRLVEASRRIEAARGNPLVFMGPPPGAPDALAFLRATGFTEHSTLWDLDLRADVPVPAPVWPSGVTPRPFERDADLESWVALFNAAFADHVTPLQLDAALIRAGEIDEDRRDEDLLLVADAGDPDRFLGFVACEPGREGEGVAERAEIWTMGVDPSRQGAGLGRQLLRWGVTYLRSLGVRTVTLSVNGRNERALGLYESEGFVRTHTRARWARAT